MHENLLSFCFRKTATHKKGRIVFIDNGIYTIIFFPDNSSLRGWMRKGLKAKPLNENEKYHMINEKTSTGEYRYLLTINNLNDDDFGLYVVYLSGCNGGLVTLESKLN